MLPKSPRATRAKVNLPPLSLAELAQILAGPAVPSTSRDGETVAGGPKRERAASPASVVAARR